MLSDADFIWEIGDFNKKLLFADKFQVFQKTANLHYSNLRLIKASLEWECIGATHEYWQEKPGQGHIVQHTLATLTINDIDDGGHKADKFIRDKKLLMDELATDIPDGLRMRDHFYLGQTLKTLREFDDSILNYKKRIEMQGWAEEVYYSYYQIGQIYKGFYETDKKEEDLNLAIEWLIKGWEYRPTRAESLAVATTLLRTASRHQEAYDLAIKGKKIKMPNDILFIETTIYQWHFDLELLMTAFYLGKFQEGADACVYLLEQDLPHDTLKLVQDNCKFYI